MMYARINTYYCNVSMLFYNHVKYRQRVAVRELYEIMIPLALKVTLFPLPSLFAEPRRDHPFRQFQFGLEYIRYWVRAHFRVSTVILRKCLLLSLRSCRCQEGTERERASRGRATQRPQTTTCSHVLCLPVKETRTGVPPPPEIHQQKKNGVVIVASSSGSRKKCQLLDF